MLALSADYLAAVLATPPFHTGELDASIAVIAAFLGATVVLAVYALRLESRSRRSPDQDDAPPRAAPDTDR